MNQDQTAGGRAVHSGRRACGRSGTNPLYSILGSGVEGAQQHGQQHCGEAELLSRSRTEQWQITGGGLKKTDETHTRSTIVGIDDVFHPRVLLDLGDETCQLVSDYLHVVMGKWSNVASCVMSFFLPSCADGDKPIALIPWWARARSLLLSEWRNEKHKSMGCVLVLRVRVACAEACAGNPQSPWH